MDEPPVTVAHGPLSYERPKGAGGKLLPLLCPPTDALQLRALTQIAGRGALLLSGLLVRLSPLLAAAWLVFVRRELLIGHVHDAVLVSVLGLLAFLGAEAATKAAAARDAGVFSAADRGAYQTQPPPSFARARAAPPPASSAPGAAASAPPAAPTALPPVRTAATTDTPAPGPGARSLPPQPATPPTAPAVPDTSALVKQIKRRIIALERVLSGTELAEADLSPDALGHRVRALCTEVGVPYGRPGGSSSGVAAGGGGGRVSELESLLGHLDALGRALGVEELMQ